MTDEELEQRIRDELHSRINPPESAPEAVREHVLSLRSMQEVRPSASGHGAHSFRNLFVIAAAVAVVALLTTGLFAWQSVKPRTGTAKPPGGIEMFGRLDSKTAWAESGSDLYITRDGGVTWSHGTVPGGRSFGQLRPGYASDTPALSTPTPIYSDSGSGSNGEPVGSGSILDYLPDHLYPTFVDADHGWLLSWTVANPMNLQTAVWTLTVHRTHDGGQTWESAQLPGTYRGYGWAQFVDSQHGWVTVYRLDYATSSGGGPEASPLPSPTPPADTTTILATSDGGVTWSPVSTLSALTIVRFTSASEAWGTETGYVDAVAHSTDGGHTWSRSTLPMPQCSTVPNAMSIPARIGGSLVLRLVCDQTGNAPGGSPYAVLTFASTDDGHTWTLDSTNQFGDTVFNTGISAVLNLPAVQPIVTYGASMTDIGTGPTPLGATFDGGGTWLTYPTAGLPSPVSVAEWASPDDVWVMVGSSGLSAGGMSGQLYATNDTGNTWKALLAAPAWPASPAPGVTPILVQVTPQPVTQNMPTISSAGRVDENVGWAVVAEPSGSFDLRLTEDGGATWSEPRSLPLNGDVQFIDADHGWMLTSDVFDPGVAGAFAVVLRTVDGGRTWDKAAGGIDLGTLPGNPQKTISTTSIHFRSALDGEVYAAFGVMADDPAASPDPAAQLCEQFSTSDAGATWSKAKPAPCMTQITFVDATLAYGSDWQFAPVMHISVDGGQTWIDGNLPPPAELSGASSIAANVQLLERRADGSLRAMVSWTSGRVLTTTVTSADGGTTWTTAGTARGFSTSGYWVAWLGEGHWLALDPNSTTSSAADALASEDGGVTWKAIPVRGLPGATLTPRFVSATDGWVAAFDRACESSSGEQGCDSVPWALYGTKDGGATWTPILIP